MPIRTQNDQTVGSQSQRSISANDEGGLFVQIDVGIAVLAHSATVRVSERIGRGADLVILCHGVEISLPGMLIRSKEGSNGLLKNDARGHFVGRDIRKAGSNGERSTSRSANQSGNCLADGKQSHYCCLEWNQ